MLRSLDDAARAAIERRFARARRRTLVLDYDGTLRELEPSPELAAPTAEIRRLLADLAELPHTAVHLVSGRSRETMNAWFGDLLLGLGAEHGYLARDPGGEWRPLVEVDLTWRPGVERAMRRAARELPGAMVELKTASVAWHDRQAEAVAAARLRRRLLAELETLLRGSAAEILPGRRVVEVRAQGVDKGRYVAALSLSGASSGEFVLAAGDDVTDVDMFAALPRRAIALQVGRTGPRAGLPGAGYGVASPRALRALLAALPG